MNDWNFFVREVGHQRQEATFPQVARTPPSPFALPFPFLPFLSTLISLPRIQLRGVWARTAAAAPIGVVRIFFGPPVPSLPFPSPLLPLIQIRGLGERCKLPQRGPDAPTVNAFLRILGSQNASHFNIFSHLRAMQMTVLLICGV